MSPRTLTPADVRIENVCISVGGRGAARTILNRLNLQVPAGTFLGIVGTNGCGKSTLLSALYRARPIDSGRITVGEQDIHAHGLRENARLVGALPQAEDGGLDFRVWEVVQMGRFAVQVGESKGEDATVCREVMEKTGVWHLAERRMLGLSGGERQRVLIARALAQQTPVLVLDEPTNHLDLKHQIELFRMLREMRDRTVIAALHDLNLAMECDLVAVLRDGQVASIGPPEEVLTPAEIEATYGVRPGVVRHPTTGAPRMVFDI